jgi:hypothetical protein
MPALKMITYSLDQFGFYLLGAASFFMKKIPMALPAMFFLFLLVLVRSPQNSTGVCLIALIAFVLMMASIAVLFFYDVKRTLETVALAESL